MLKTRNLYGKNKWIDKQDEKNKWDSNKLKETNTLKWTYSHLDELIRILDFAFKTIALDENSYEDLLFIAFDTKSHTI